MITEDDQCKHLLSHVKQQTSIAIDRRIRFIKHKRNWL